MSYAIALTNKPRTLVADLFDPPGRRGAPARIPRSYEGSEASARAWLEVASVGYQAWRTSI